MATFTMSVVNSMEFKKACTCCQMAFGCLYEYEGRMLHIVAFSEDDAPVIVETLESAGSHYIGIWTL